MLYYLLFFCGFGSLILGSHLLINALVQLSYFFRVKPLFLSIVVLGFVTSSSEWFVTFMAAYKQVSELAISNIIGSNTINILFILSLGYLFCRPQKIDSQIVRFDLPCLLSFLIVLGWMMYDGLLDFKDCVICLILFGGYLAFLFKKRKTSSVENSPATIDSLTKSYSFLILGFVLLFGGSYYLIDSSVYIGEQLGLSQRFLGFFVFSLGTSLPELSTIIASALKKQSDMIVGNIVGSNIFNSLFILGSSGLFQNLEISSSLHFDYLFMFLISGLLWFVIYFFQKIPRWTCLCFLIVYFGYTYGVFKNVSFFL